MSTVGFGQVACVDIDFQSVISRAELTTFLATTKEICGKMHRVTVFPFRSDDGPALGDDFVLRGESFQYFLDVKKGNARVYMKVPAESWQVTNPLRQLFSWLLDMEGGVLLHAAAIRTTGLRTALIAGPSGSGKSSIAAAAWQRGLTVFGDDWVPLFGPTFCWVSSLYTSLKLAPDVATALKLKVPTGLVTDKGKLVYHIGEGSPLTGEVRAIFVPKIVEEGIGVRPIDKFEAFRLIAPSTLLQSQGISTNVLGRIRALCETMPCYELSTSLEMLSAVPSLIAGLT